MSVEAFAEFTGFEVAHAADPLTAACAKADMSTLNVSYPSANVTEARAPVTAGVERESSLSV